MRNLLFFVAFSFMAFTLPAAHAQEGTPQSVPGHIAAFQENCIPGKWESAACLRAMAVSNKDLAAVYAESLQNERGKPEADTIIQHCAASTAAATQSVPAYAMASAMTECANAIVDMAEKTQILPGPTRYQLLIAGILCLNKDAQCARLEQGIGNFK